MTAAADPWEMTVETGAAARAGTNGHAPPPPDLETVKRRILAALDVAGEYAALGVQFTGNAPNAKGWRECHAVGREDDRPSAAVNVVSGLYHDSGGEGETLSFWDFALRFGPDFGQFKDVLKHYADKAGIPLGKLKTHSGNRTREATYEYRDAAGIVRYVVYRYRLANGKKSFTQHPIDRHGNPGYGAGCMDGVEPLPYRLPELLASMDDVFVVEGEKDAERLAALGLIATTNHQGAASTDRTWPRFIEYFRGRNVVVIPDNDAGGRKHARRVAELLRPVASSVKVLELPGLGAKGDASDWLDAGGTAAELRALAEAAPLWEPEAANGHADPDVIPIRPGRIPPREDNGDGPPRINRTDLGNATRLVRSFGMDLRFCHPWGCWLAWTGQRWQQDETGLIYRHARGVVAQLHAEADAEPDTDTQKAMRAWALASEAERRINAMASLARHASGVPVLPRDLDRGEWLLNCPNGTLDLRTGDLKPHQRADLLTKLCGAVYDPDARAPLWESFLTRISGDNPELVQFLRRAVGYALTGSIAEHALFFLYGRGRNGKSTFVNTIQQVFGEYGITINADLLTAKNQGEHPTGIADLQGRRFVATIEVEDGKRLAESLVKTLTGGDRIRARRMRQDFYEFDPTHKLFLAANHKPVIRGTDDGIWRRIRLIPFSVQIPDEEVDPELPRKLLREAPGILAWAVRGCLEWQEDGLKDTAVVTAATAEYRAEMDELAGFLDEKCEVGDDLKVRMPDLYAAYAAWCKTTGSYQCDQRKLGRVLTERGFPADKSNSSNWRLGIDLRKDF